MNGLERILELVDKTGNEKVLDALTSDPGVRGLLLILPVSLALWCAIGLAVWAWVK